MPRLTIVIAAALLAIAPAQAQDSVTTAEANAMCRATIDARDYETFKAARNDSIDLVFAQLRGKTRVPSVQEAAALSSLLKAVNTDLAAAIDQLRSLPASPALDGYLAYGQSQIDVNTARIGFLADLDDWQWPLAETLETSSYDYIGGMAELGFADRDCAHVFGSLGNPPELADFIPVVAPACSTAYDNLLATDLDSWREQNMKALAAVLQGKPQDPDAVHALRATANAWAGVVSTFALADRELANSPPSWQEALDVMAGNSQIYAARANAIESGDPDTIALTFERRIRPLDFRAAGLDETTCIALMQVM